MVAAPPDYVPPVVKKPKPKEEKVQKPDMALSDLVDRRSPLADQLKALRERVRSMKPEVRTGSTGPSRDGSRLASEGTPGDS